MNTTTHTMDPDPTSHLPSTAPEATPADDSVEAEIVDGGEDLEGDGPSAVAPYSEVAVAQVADLTPAQEVEAASTGMMSRAEYRALADKLIFNRAMWHEYFDRCRCFASVGMYGHKDPATVAAAGLKGMSLGMSFLEALDRIKVIHGTPVIRGAAAINHIHERCKGAKCRCIVSTDREAVWRMERPGWDPKEFRFTWEDAEKAKLTTKKDSAYTKYPARCLKWQCASEGAQEMFGDVLGGLYFQEELDAEQAIESTTASASASYAPAKDTPSSTGDGDGSSSTRSVETPVHPKVARVKELLGIVSERRGATPETADAVRKAVYHEAIGACEIKLAPGQQPTLPHLDKLLAHLEAQC